MTLTDSQQAELASTGRVVVAVPCDPQPEWVPNFAPGISFWACVDNECYGQDVPFGDVCYSNDAMREHFIDNVLGEGLAPHNLDDKIPTPAGDAIVRDVDVRLNEVWEWVVTLERLENSNV